MNMTISAPTTARRMVPMLHGLSRMPLTPSPPRRPPMNPPTIAPTTPRMIVIPRPMACLPGMMARAMRPMIAPMMIQEMIAQRRPMRGTPFCQGKELVVQPPVWPRIPRKPRIDEDTAGHGVDHAVRTGEGNPPGGFFAAVRTPGMQDGPGVIARPVRSQGRGRPCGCSEVPVVVLGLDGLAHHVARAGAGEEVVVLVGVRGERGEDRRVHLGGVLREQALVAEVHQRLVGVVAQEHLHVLGPADRVVEVLGVDLLVLVQLQQQREGVLLQLCTALGGELLDGLLVL